MTPSDCRERHSVPKLPIVSHIGKPQRAGRLLPQIGTIQNELL